MMFGRGDSLSLLKNLQLIAIYFTVFTSENKAFLIRNKDYFPDCHNVDPGWTGSAKKYC